MQERLSAFGFEIEHNEPSDLIAQLISNGGVVGHPFGTIYGIFTDAFNDEAVKRIYDAKGREASKRLVGVTPPARFRNYIDFDNFLYNYDTLKRIVAMTERVHTMGFILPLAKEEVPSHMLTPKGEMNTGVIIWAEKPEVRRLMESLDQYNIKLLAGTSANKSGQGTHYNFDELYEDFKNSPYIDLFVDAGNLQKHPDATRIFVQPRSRNREIFYRNVSSTIVDLTHINESGNPQPHILREGNMPAYETTEAFDFFGLPKPIKNEATVKLPAPRAPSLINPDGRGRRSGSKIVAA